VILVAPLEAEATRSSSEINGEKRALQWGFAPLASLSFVVVQRRTVSFSMRR
jgi:hypothetical protein